MVLYKYMDKSQKKASSSRRHKNPILEHPVISVIVALVLVIAIILVFKAIQDNQEKADSSTPASTEQTVPTATAQNTATNNQTNSNASDIVPGKTPAQYEGDNANNSDTLTGTINVATVAGDKLIIRVTIDQLLSGTGTCELTLSNSGQVLKYQANTIDNPSSASCEGFDIPVSSLSAGDWDVNINVTTSDRTGTLTGKVTI